MSKNVEPWMATAAFEIATKAMDYDDVNEDRAAEIIAAHAPDVTELVRDAEGTEYECDVDLWLTERVREGKGAVVLCETENGDIGVFVGDKEKSLGAGDSAFEALHAALAKFPAPKE